jgi:hypothetical protein
MRHDLDLLENAIDSLNEALAKYQQGKAGDPKAYKFCVLHLVHFIELVLKHYVALSHPLLIYKNPFSKEFGDDSQTIGLQDSINFLRNEGKEPPKDFLDDLLWLKKLRNQIEHHKVRIDLTRVNEVIGRLIHAIVQFDQAHDNLGLEKSIDPTQFHLFLKLADNYQLNLDRAKAEVAAAEAKAYDGYRPKEYGLVVFTIVACGQCGHDTMIPNEDSFTGYRCTFCGEEEADDVPITCGVCGDTWDLEQMDYTEWAEGQPKEFVCPRCRRDPAYVKDD